MTRNMGWIDRGLRLLIAAALVWAAFALPVAAAGVLHWGALAIAGIFTLTSLVGFCPLYTLLGFKTCKAS